MTALQVFPRSTPNVRVSTHSAFHQSSEQEQHELLCLLDTSTPLTRDHSSFSLFGRKLLRFDLRFSATIQQLIVFRCLLLVTKFVAFPRSDNLIRTYTVRLLLWTCQLEYACNILRRFSTSILLFRTDISAHFCAVMVLILSFAGFVSPSCGHSNHRYFMDFRPISSTACLWVAFVIPTHKRHIGILRLLSADFIELLTILLTELPVEV